jgi:L-seryl-tRNA(Ser) seleniumtransferase
MNRGWMAMNVLTSLPSVEQLLQTEQATTLVGEFGRDLTLQAVREALRTVRGQLQAENIAGAPPRESILRETARLLGAWTEPALRGVINATGVILHTNLGRAPLSRAAIAAMTGIAGAYSNLELDLETGKRGGRASDVEALLQRITGAEGALVVNNNAAAVMLILSAVAPRKRVAIARSQLVEIGGGFRMPDIMRHSGAKLFEVGTTNKVRLTDYEEAFRETAVVLKVHRSNFKMIGFVDEPEFTSLADAAHRAGQVVVEDLGSGALLDTSAFGLAHEPTVQESLAAGADLVCFSGDKLLGGPQAGIIIGNAELITKIRRHPLARAVRADKLTLAALGATLLHYAKGEAVTEVPVWRMIAMSDDEARGRAEAWARVLGTGHVMPADSTLGGGSMPGELLPTHVLGINAPHPDDLVMKLRRQMPPIIARTEKATVLLDPRTVDLQQDDQLLGGLSRAVKEKG